MRLSDNSEDPNDLECMRRYKDAYRRTAEEQHRTHNKHHIATAENKPRAIWNVINKESGRTRKIRNPEAPTHDALNEFYTRPLNETTESIHVVHRSRESQSCIFFRPTDHVEIEEIISGLKTKKTEDIYGISTETLKLIQRHISHPLAEIFNKCMQQGNFPDKLKIAKIIPVYKKGNKKECQNYRPIAILPAISKILEKIILRRLATYFSKHKLLTKDQFAYQPGKNTITAIKELISNIQNALEQRKKCAAQLCDLSRVFD